MNPSVPLGKDFSDQSKLCPLATSVDIDILNISLLGLCSICKISKLIKNHHHSKIERCSVQKNPLHLASSFTTAIQTPNPNPQKPKTLESLKLNTKPPILNNKKCMMPIGQPS